MEKINTITEIENKLKTCYNLLKEMKFECISEYEQDIKILFAQNVSFLRSYLGFLEQSTPFTQQEFAKKLGISIGAIKQWENGSVLPNQIYLLNFLTFVDNLIKKTNNPAESEDHYVDAAELYCKNLILRLPQLIILKSVILHTEREEIDSSDHQILTFIKSIQHNLELNLNTMLEHFPGAIFILTEDGTCTDNWINWKPYRERHTNLPKTFVGLNLTDMSQTDKEKVIFQEILKRVINKKSLQRYHSEYEGYHYEIKITPFGEDQLIMVVIDLQDEWQLRNSLKQEQELLNTIIDNMPDSIFIIDRNLNIKQTWLKPDFTETFPFMINSTGKNFKTIVPPPQLTKNQDLLALAGSIINETFDKGKLSTRVEHMNQVFDFRTVVLNHDSMIAAVRNITESVEQNLHFRTLINNVQEGVFLIQEEKIVYLNPAYSKMLGLAPKEAQGNPFIDFIAPEDKDMIIKMHRDRMNGLPAKDEYELRVINAAGIHRTVNIKASVVQYENKPAVLGTCRDITDQKNEFEITIQKQKQLENIIASALELLIPDSKKGRTEFLNKLLTKIESKK